MVGTFSDEDTSSDEDDTRMSYIIVSSDDQIEIHANLKYEKKFINLVHMPRFSYAICNSAADICVVEK